MAVLSKPLPTIASLLFFIAFFPVAKGGWVRATCYSNVQNMLQNGSLASNDTIFLRDRNGTFMSDPYNPILTLPGCQQICGRGFEWYADIGPRLSIWIIPVFLLISNMEVSPLDKRRYLMILHLLGDPIDSLWCLLLKQDAWTRCYGLAHKVCGTHDRRKVRNLATLLGGIEELVGFNTDPLKVFTSIVSRSNLTADERDILIGRSAQKLADSRSDERLRTLLTTVLYFYQIVSAFVATIGGGQTSPPGGRIGTAMFMTWIVPTILLSNAIGGFTSIRTCFTVIEDFAKDATSNSDLWGQLLDAAPALRCYASLDEYFDSLSWSGGIYTYRPKKHIGFGDKSSGRNTYGLLVLAVSPVLISSLIGTIILWNTPPIGINCRNILIFTITTLLFLSTGLTSQISRFRLLSRRAHWYLTLTKDAFIAIPSVLFIFLATSGLFNSCWCWSGVYSLGKLARVPLNPTPQFDLYNKTTYPILVGVCLGLQIVVFFVMMKAVWVGWNVIRWSEKEKREEWNMSRSGGRVRKLES